MSLELVSRHATRGIVGRNRTVAPVNAFALIGRSRWIIRWQVLAHSDLGTSGKVSREETAGCVLGSTVRTFRHVTYGPCPLCSHHRHVTFWLTQRLRKFGKL